VLQIFIPVQVVQSVSQAGNTTPTTSHSISNENEASGGSSKASGGSSKGAKSKRTGSLALFFRKVGGTFVLPSHVFMDVVPADWCV